MSASKKKLERREANASDPIFTEKQKREQKEAQAKKRSTILSIAAGVIITVLVIALLVWRSGIFQRNTVALTANTTKFSTIDMNYYYHEAINKAYYYEQMYQNFYSSYGMTYTPAFDPSQDLSTQYTDADETQSFRDYFLETAKTDASQTAALYDAAKAAGFQLDEEAQEELEHAATHLSETAQQYNFSNVDQYLRAVYGRHMNQAVYLRNYEMTTIASAYYAATTEAMGEYTDDELIAYYTDHPDLLDSYDYDIVTVTADMPQSTTDAEGNTVQPSDEEKAAAMAQAKEKAEAIIAAVKAAQPDESDESALSPFAQAAQTIASANVGSYTKILGSNISSSSYGEWLMDAARKDGDMDLFEIANNGYYVVLFHGRARNDDPTMDVRHILFKTALADDPATEDVDESQNTPSDEHIAAIKDQAQEVLDRFLAGEQTSEAFAALAEEFSEDGRDAETGDLNAAGGLYEAVSPDSSYVQPWLDWIFADGRKQGDTGLVQTTSGWHIMYLDGYSEPTWKDPARDARKSAEQADWLEATVAGYDPVTTDAFAKVGVK